MNKTKEEQFNEILKMKNKNNNFNKDKNLNNNEEELNEERFNYASLEGKETLELLRIIFKQNEEVINKEVLLIEENEEMKKALKEMVSLSFPLTATYRYIGEELNI